MTAGSSDDFRPGPSMSLPPWMRPLAADQSEPYDSPPIVPSIRREDDHLEFPDRVEYTLRQLDAALAVIHQLMKRLGVATINLPGAMTELGPRAEIKRGDAFYHVNAGKQKGGS